MNQKRLLISAVIIALVIGGGFILSVPHTARDLTPQAAVTTPPVIPIVTLTDTVKKGEHIITGSLEAPNACAKVSGTARLEGTASSTDAYIMVAVSSTSDDQVCLQLPTRFSFTTTISAPAGMPIRAMVNGALASTTLP